MFFLINNLRGKIMQQNYLTKGFYQLFQTIATMKMKLVNENLDKMPLLSQSQNVLAVLKPANTSRLTMTSSSCSQCHQLASTVQKYRDGNLWCYNY